MDFGLFCSTRDSVYSTNRSFRLASLTKEKLFDTVSKNLADLPKIIELCQNRGILMFRLGNAIVPFASHQSFEDEWWDELGGLFENTKKQISKSGVRLTIHPGQFIQLGSPKEEVVSGSLLELKYCFRVLDLLGADKNGVVTLHLGGAHGDKEATINRFCEVFRANEWLAKYLALENDEYNFDAKETLYTADKCGIPFIFDIFHHSINPSQIEWRDIKNSWGSKKPKLHISSQAEGGKKGMHADFISEDDFLTLVHFLGEDAKSVDVMVEAKAKEDAIAALKSRYGGQNDNR